MSATTSFDERFGPGSARSSLAINYASRPAPRTDFDAEFGHIQGQLGGHRARGAGRPARAARHQAKRRCRCRGRGRPWPVFIRKSIRRRRVGRAYPVREARRSGADEVLAGVADAGGWPVWRAEGSVGAWLRRSTAVYDVSARAVYLPNGTKLEAHSGLGGLMDNPAYVDRRMVGAAPQNVYDLKPREKLFHGVAALRMTPVGENEMHGRTACSCTAICSAPTAIPTAASRSGNTTGSSRRTQR